MSDSDLRTKLFDTIDHKRNEIRFKLGDTIPMVSRMPKIILIMAFLASLAYAIFLLFDRPHTLSLMYIFVVLVPLGAWYYFRKLSGNANSDLFEEVGMTDSSESEITRIIDKYSGFADGIGTALPLFGAAVLLGVVALGDSGDQATYKVYIEKYFMNLAVPFEVVSILVLASAKLYESVFDELSLRYQEVIDHAKIVEKKYYHDETIQAIRSIGREGSVTFSTDMNADQIRELKELYSLMGKAADGLGSENVLRSLQSIVALSGKTVNNGNSNKEN